MSEILSELEEGVEREKRFEFWHCRVCGKPLHPFKDDVSGHLQEHAKAENEQLRLWLGRKA